MSFDSVLGVLTLEHACSNTYLRWLSATIQTYVIFQNIGVRLRGKQVKLCWFLLQDVDPNDEKLMVLLEGMAVEKNGKIYKVTYLYFVI